MKNTNTTPTAWKKYDELAKKLQRNREQLRTASRDEARRICRENHELMSEMDRITA